MIILFFGNENCVKCKSLLEQLVNADITKKATLKIVDAFKDEYQDFCDEHGVDELPHIKIYHENKLLYELIGYGSSSDVKLIIDTVNNIK